MQKFSRLLSIYCLATVVFIQRRELEAAFKFGRAREVNDDGAIKHLVRKRFGGFVLIHRSRPKDITTQRKLVRRQARADFHRQERHFPFHSAAEFQFAQELGKVELGMSKVHLVEQYKANSILQTRIALVIASALDPFFLALGEEPQHRLGIELVVNRVKEAEHGFLRIPVRLDGQRFEHQPAEVRIEAGQF